MKKLEREIATRVLAGDHSPGSELIEKGIDTLLATRKALGPAGLHAALDRKEGAPRGYVWAKLRGGTKVKFHLDGRDTVSVVNGETRRGSAPLVTIVAARTSASWVYRGRIEAIHAVSQPLWRTCGQHFEGPGGHRASSTAVLSSGRGSHALALNVGE